MILAGRFQYRLIVLEWVRLGTMDAYEAVAHLFNAGYRGKDLVLR